MIPEKLEVVFLRPGMYVREPTYEYVTTFIDGYHHGRGDSFHRDFKDWLLNEFKVRSPQGWPWHVAYVFERKHGESFNALTEEQKLEFLHGLLGKYYEGDERK